MQRRQVPGACASWRCTGDLSWRAGRCLSEAIARHVLDDHGCFAADLYKRHTVEQSGLYTVARGCSRCRTGCH